MFGHLVWFMLAGVRAFHQTGVNEAAGPGPPGALSASTLVEFVCGI